MTCEYRAGRAERDIAQSALQNPTASYEQTGAIGAANPIWEMGHHGRDRWRRQRENLGLGRHGKDWPGSFRRVRNGSESAGGEGSSMTISLLQNLDNPQHTIGQFRISATKAARHRPVRSLIKPFQHRSTRSCWWRRRSTNWRTAKRTGCLLPNRRSAARANSSKIGRAGKESQGTGCQDSRFADHRFSPTPYGSSVAARQLDGRDR